MPARCTYGSSLFVQMLSLPGCAVITAQLAAGRQPHRRLSEVRNIAHPANCAGLRHSEVVT